MKKTIFLISIFAILINSCKKDSEKINVVFKGRVIDYYSGIGLSNAIIYVKNGLIDPNKSQLRQIDLYDTTFISGKIITDLNGNFYKSLLLDKGTYKMIVYNNIFISLDTIVVNTASSKDLDIKVKRFKRLIVSLTNDSKISDSISLKIYTINNIFQIFALRANDTMIFYNKAIPEYDCYLVYEIYKNRFFRISRDTTISMSKFSTDSIKLKY